ncbi:MAG: hypothetical protein ABW022_25585 [Actinoplanes sp.]
MTDQLDEMFAEARAEALPSVRPPGVGAARRTVRRRRGTAAAVVTAVVVAAIAVGSAVAFRPSPEPVPNLVYQTVLGGRPATPAVDWHGPVHEGYSRSAQIYVPALTVRVACAGAGQITLLVSVASRELARVPAICSPKPVAAEQRVVLPNPISSKIVIELLDIAGQGEFAYRLTGDFPVNPADPANSPVEAVKRPSRTPLYTASGVLNPDEQWREVQPAHALTPGKEYTLAAACGGEGVMEMELFYPDGSNVYLRPSCSWPPGRQTVTTSPIPPGTVFWLRYTSDNSKLGQFAVAAYER